MRYKLQQFFYWLSRSPRQHLRFESQCFDQRVITSTCFWRNGEQLKVLAENVLPALSAKLNRPLRVAVHGGSVGCEAVSLLMAAEMFGFNKPLKIFSFDIDPDAIAHARSGRYEEIYFQDPECADRQLIPLDIREKYLPRQSDGYYYRIGCLDRQLVFEVCDMTCQRSISKWKKFDLILCQNALVHLQGKKAQLALRNLISILSDDGLLVLGGTPPDQLSELTSQFELKPVPARNRQVYEAWTNRQRLWKANPSSHLGLEPYNETDPNRNRRYGHIFATNGSWFEYPLLTESSDLELQAI